MLARTLGPLAGITRDVTGWLWLFSTAANFLLLAAPIYMIQIYGQILPGHGIETLLYLTGLILLALALYGLVEAVRSVITQKLSARYDLTATEALLRVRQDATEGDPSERLRDVATARQVIAGRTLPALYDLPFAPLFFVILFVAHPVLGMIAVAGAAVLVVLALANSRALGETTEIGGLHQFNANRFAIAAMRQGEDVRAMGMAPQMLERWEREALLANRMGNAAGTTNAVYFGVTRFVRQALQILMLGVGAWLVLNGHMAAGLIFAASLLSGRALQPIEQLIGGWRQLEQGLSAHRRVAAAIAAGSEGVEPVTLPTPQGRLSLEGAGVAILCGQAPLVLLDDVELDVAPGEILAVMGPSGAGKSTLARVMAGIQRPTVGHIRLDGFDLDQWDEVQRGAAIGYVGQGSDVPEGTVAEIIARFRADAADAEIVAAAQRARIHDFVARLPEGYNTRLGRGGIRLSGGQVQRLLLARALFGEPRLLVLDEPNAHLDRDGEQALVDVLGAERERGAAIVVVSQRNSVLSVADRVALMRNGKIESCGPVARRTAPSTAPAATQPERLAARVSNVRRIHTPAAVAEPDR